MTQCKYIPNSHYPRPILFGDKEIITNVIKGYRYFMNV